MNVLKAVSIGFVFGLVSLLFHLFSTGQFDFGLIGENGVYPIIVSLLVDFNMSASSFKVP